jgi:hypothetical protein
MTWRRRHDVAGGAVAILFIAAAAVSWHLAERYRNTFRLKRAAAPLKYDDGVIHYLRHGHEIAVGLVLVVAVMAAARVIARKPPIRADRRLPGFRFTRRKARPVDG